VWFNPETVRHLATLLEIPATCVSEATGNVIRHAWIDNNFAMEGIVHERDGDTHTDLAHP